MAGLLRFFAWLGLVVSALVLAGAALLYGPCFAGVAEACMSGVLLLPVAAFVLLIGGPSLAVLWFTRRRTTTTTEAP